MIVGLSGRKQSGKDLAGRYVQQLLYKNKRGESNIESFAGKLKEVVAMLLKCDIVDFENEEFKNKQLDWSFKNEPLTPRMLLQTIGTDCVRKLIHEDTWIDILFHNADINKNLIITDVRFPNEADAIKDRGGIVIRLTREVCPVCGESENHHVNYDYTKQDMPIESILCNKCGTFFHEDAHESETALDNYDFNYIIENHGTKNDLFTELKKIIL